MNPTCSPRPPVDDHFGSGGPLISSGASGICSISPAEPAMSSVDMAAHQAFL